MYILEESNEDLSGGKQLKVSDKGKKTVDDKGNKIRRTKRPKMSVENYVPKYTDHVGNGASLDRHPITNDAYKPLSDDPFYSGKFKKKI